MRVGLLYSGGTDSTLAGLLLEPFYDVTCLCASFGVTDDVEHALAAAAAVGWPARRLDLDEAVAREAVARMATDGYPRNGIQRVHEHALEVAAGLAGAQDLAAVADGTRRDDRVPTVPREVAQSLEDRHGVAHLAPLAGVGSGARAAMAERALERERGPSEAVPTGDYEGELRALLATAHGEAAVGRVFPAHEQSRVTGRRTDGTAGPPTDGP